MIEPNSAHYPAHLAAVRRAFDQALAAGGYDEALIYAGHPPTAFLDDHGYPFIVNPLFNWWVPLPDHAHGFVHYVPGNKPVLVYHRPADYWHKPPPVPAGFWVDGFDLRVVGNADETAAALAGNAHNRVYLGEWASAHAGLGFSATNPDDLLALLHEARTVKSDWEVDCMRCANRIAARGHRAAESAFRSGASEFEMHLAYLAATGHTDRELPYDNIIALNENGATLHYTDRERSRPGQIRSFLIDAGASYAGYAADITRTWSNQPDDRFAGLIEQMDTAQRKLCTGATAGTDYVELNAAAHRAIGAILADSSLIRLPADDIVDMGITRTFLPHGLGHFIGLQVHDVAGHQIDGTGKRREPPAEHPFLRLTRTLQPGNVTTIEPGLYFIDLKLDELRASAHAKHVDWKQIDALRPFGGIRIEDDVVINASGPPENLSRDAFGGVRPSNTLQ